MQVSVLLPARNASATVRAAVESMLSQTLPPDEIILVDDASTDGTAGALPASPLIKIVQGEGRGLVAALNLGLRSCRGDVIARMDADDVSHPERLRLQLELLASNPKLGAAGSLVECESM
ncbi:MAG TPA: glycosyltransferase family 2 protein, partial [Myxococcales bacterium]|nr:glycosyltransferase family 2 protein [Myxococcales bacterium]